MWSVDFKPVSNSSLLCSGSEDGTVCMWDARSGRLARRFEGGHTAPVYCVRWSPDGAMLATGSEDCRVSSAPSSYCSHLLLLARFAFGSQDLDHSSRPYKVMKTQSRASASIRKHKMSQYQY